jgi:RNA ligase
MRCIEDLQKLVVQDVEDWSQYGHVNTQVDGDLILFNYNLFAQIEGEWKWFERASRGLILNQITGEVVARPYDKFFNWHENHMPKPGRRNRSISAITEKMDGSLGILYRNPEYKIATRGSFKSDQAIYATEMLYNKYDVDLIRDRVPDEATLLFEIIYPENRIVIDYGTEECLFLIGARNRLTGDYYNYEWRRTIAEQCGFRLPSSFDSLIEAGNRSVDHITAHIADWSWQEEGVVVEFTNGSFWKFKSPEYCRVHKILSTVNFKNVLEAYKAGTLDDTMALIPEHYQKEVEAMVREIRETILTTTSTVNRWFEISPKEKPRKDYAQWVMQYCPDLQRYMFPKLDGKDILPIIFKHEFRDRDNRHLVGDV